MVKVRQDAWIEENDILLAETVLRHVREGSTQLSAFEEVGDALNRTAAACGFRWNAVVRRDYEKELEDAKKERKQAMRVLGKDFKRRGQQLYSTFTRKQRRNKGFRSIISIIARYGYRLSRSHASHRRRR